MAILFGSKIGSFENETFQYYLEFFTYCSFLFFGIFGFIPRKEKENFDNSKFSFLQKLSNVKLNYVLIIAINIVIGELGDKTFLASLGLGLQYPDYKVSLILGSIAGMVGSNSIALFFGRFLGNRFNPKFVEFLSNIVFIAFGLIGFFNLFF